MWKCINKVEYFKYLGILLDQLQYVNIRIVKAWAALNSMNSNLSNRLKRHFFRASVESVLVYGSVT